ncbi:MAG: nucleoside-triphosphatase [Bacteroidota bacterium]
MAIHITQKAIPEKWMKAAVVGSLWAVIEIVLGSMLHNLKMPMTGTALSFITVYMIVAFFQLWPTKGIIWRAGLICALMKSLSPSAVILGPMAGILSEAILLELAIRLIGKNAVGYILGGALAVFSALMQKAITFVILYGWDIVALLDNMYQFAVRQLNIENVPPVYALGLLSLIYLVSGAAAAFAGFRSGKKFIVKEQAAALPKMYVGAKGRLLGHTRKRNYAMVLLPAIFLLLIAGLLLVSRSNICLSGSFAAIFTLVMYWRYPQNMRFLRKPGLWSQLGIIVLFSALFFNGFSAEALFQKEGWLVGIKMVFRALILLSAFSGISNELKNPLVKNILYQRGLKNLYQSLEIAFSALPGLMNAFSMNKKTVTGFRKLTFTMLQNARALLQQFIHYEQSRPDIFILTGDVDEGKTTTARKITSLLKVGGYQVAGFFSAKLQEGANKHSYAVEEISSGRQVLLCSPQADTGPVRTGRFYFSEEGLSFGRNILLQAAEQPPDLIVVDELGPLELNDKGWTPALEQVLNQSSIPQLWIVREKLVNIIMRKWHIGNVIVFNIKADSPEKIVEEMKVQLQTTK